MKFNLNHDPNNKTLAIPRAALQLSGLAGVSDLILHTDSGCILLLPGDPTITSADGPLTKGSSDAAGARRPPASDKPPMSMNGLLRCQAKLTQPKAGVAACLAMIPSAYNGTFCPATAASNGGSSERSSEG